MRALAPEGVLQMLGTFPQPVQPRLQSSQVNHDTVGQGFSPDITQKNNQGFSPRGNLSLHLLPKPITHPEHPAIDPRIVKPVISIRKMMKAIIKRHRAPMIAKPLHPASNLKRK